MGIRRHRVSDQLDVPSAGGRVDREEGDGLRVENRDKKLNAGQRFQVESLEQYRFLIDNLGLVGPNVADDLISYHAGHYSIYVMRDTFSNSVTTVVFRPVGGTTRRAEIACLYAAIGLGPAQDVKRRARTSRLAAEAIATQAKALKLVLPHLKGPYGDRLMEACHARY